MTIGKRLMLLLAVPLIALLGFGVFARIQLSRIEERSRFVSESQLAGVAVLGNISRSFAEIRVNVRSFLLATDQTQRAEARAAFDEDDRVLTQLLQQYRGFSDQRWARPQAFRRFQGFEPAVHRRSPARDDAGRGGAEGRCPRLVQDQHCCNRCHAQQDIQRVDRTQQGPWKQRCSSRARGD